jgi:hypothetical protein
LNSAVTIELAINATRVEIKLAGTLINHRIAKQGSPSKRAKIKISLGCCFKNMVSSNTDLIEFPLLEVLT